MRRWLTIALGGLVLSCQGPAGVLARQVAAPTAGESSVRETPRTVDRSPARR